MGYGGNLIWTSVFRTLHEHDGRAIAVAHKPLLSDLVAGRLYNGTVCLGGDAVFRHNPRLSFPAKIRKSAAALLLDRLFALAIRPEPLRKAYERWVFARAEAAAAAGGPHYVHVDMTIHSYADTERNRSYVWKSPGRAADTMLRPFLDRPAAEECELYFTAEEEAEADTLLREAGLSAGTFIAVEPDTNRDWFGDLRAWPRDRWQQVVDRLRASHPDLPVVQLGLPGSPPLAGVVDLRGRTSFRLAALIIARSRLFAGTEGGLMHAANAVRAPALILWGGLTLPEFAGYPTRQTVLCKYVACAPCGHFGWCDNDHACMRDIGVNEVAQAALALIGDV